MSTRHSGAVNTLPQTELFEFRTGHFVSVKYFFRRIFSCWHLKMSRPITRGRETYRSCVRCGMRREFDLETWTLKGRFYSPSNSNGGLLDELSDHN